MAAANAGLVVWATRAEARWRAEGARRRAASWAGAVEAVESERRVEAAGEGTSERTLTRESIAWRRGGEGGARRRTASRQRRGEKVRRFK